MAVASRIARPLVLPAPAASRPVIRLHTPRLHFSTLWLPCQAPPRRGRARAAAASNGELAAGDALALLVFCLYKQIMAIAMSPQFEGWLAPLSFNPLRFEELLGFIITVVGTWVATSTLTGDYGARAPGATPLVISPM